MNCPVCDKYMRGFKCACGYAIETEKVVDPKRHQCHFVNYGGSQCNMPGTIAKDIGKPDDKTWYCCVWHGFYASQRNSFDSFRKINPFMVEESQIERAWEIVNGNESCYVSDDGKYHIEKPKKIDSFTGKVSQDKKPDYEKKCKELFKLAVDGELKGFDLADKMYEMDKEYPDLGWYENASKVLLRYYISTGMKRKDAENNIPIKETQCVNKSPRKQ